MDKADSRKLSAPGIPRSRAEAVNDAEQRKLYAKREPVYPKLVSGPFRAFKWAFMAFALGVYYFLPFLRWDRGPDAPDQAVLVDFGASRFYFFWIEIWPQEVYYITGLLIMAALALFLATALFGRVWCGYACPQTVWTDLFIAVERAFEGDRNARIRLDRAPWTAEKIARKSGKHAVWLAIAAATGGAWILYFHDAFDLLANFFTGQAAISAYVFFGLLTFTTYTLAGTMREQVCIYMCPWPRIQAAMTDNEALNVTYRTDRGEPRGPHKKGASWEGRGDCIDCKACVAACPMGIDIRNGAQLECIGCALCIDACDDIMVKVERPKGLIAYDTDDNVARRLRGEKPRYRFLRTRVLVYAVALFATAAVMLGTYAMRTTLDVNVLRDRNPNFVTLSDGSVRNGYTVKVLNMTHETRGLELSVEGPADIAIRVLAAREDAPLTLAAPPDRTTDFRVYLTLPREAAAAAHSFPLTFQVRDLETGETARAAATFQTGAPR
ncbi:MAG: cytochrome c oxidase accessory protein CcoG [Maricaulaceae bacterium]|nr:cytochrome c oxidase accessory protein CcoG [Maricaulaceae bacterium]